MWAKLVEIVETKWNTNQQPRNRLAKTVNTLYGAMNNCQFAFTHYENAQTELNFTNFVFALDALDALSFGPPVAYVYNPLTYAHASYTLYVERYGAPPKELVLLGMNPGPFGMAQTGVPFGEVKSVRDWLKIEASVAKPAREHPKRPVEGFACHRSEVSGRRLWGWAQMVCKAPERFFARFFVANYCPLLFLNESGRNLTPDKLPIDERRLLL